MLKMSRMFRSKVLVLALLLALILPLQCENRSYKNHRGGSSGKKKVVIIGEMSDIAYELASNASSNYALSDVTFEDYEDFTSRNNHQQQNHQQTQYRRPRQRPIVTKRSGYMPMSSSGSAQQGGGSVFVPVAAYSVTHSRVGGGPGSQGQTIRRMRPGLYIYNHLLRALMDFRTLYSFESSQKQQHPAYASILLAREDDRKRGLWLCPKAGDCRISRPVFLRA